jgi:hypothetical protein
MKPSQTSREASSYAPREGSLPQRVISYFRRLPEEELSAKDIALKFDTNPLTVHQLLKTAVELDILARDGAVYQAGPYLGRIEPGAKLATEPGADTPPPAATAARTARPFVSRQTIDFAALTVEDHVPFAPAVKGGKWEPLFARLTAAGQSIAVPAIYKGALTAEAAKRTTDKRGTYKVALTGPDTARLWRIA